MSETPKPFEIRMPQVNNNDETGVLDQWMAEDGERVDADTVIAVIETSKASYDLVPEQEGVLHRLMAEGDEKDIGTPVAYLFADEAARQAWIEAQKAPTAGADGPAGALVITKGAREAMDETGVTEAQLQGLGKKVIKRADVEAVASGSAGAPTAGATTAGAPAAKTAEVDLTGAEPLPRRQRSIAEVVSQSHREIPKAFTAIELQCDPALDALARLSEETDLQVGLPELLLHALGRLRARFPFFYGEVVGKHHFRQGAADVGVTIDVGGGLFIPVVRDASSLSLEQMADLLMDFRIQAMRDSFAQEELMGGALTLSLNNEDGVLLVEPLILPGQACMLTLGGVRGLLQRTPSAAQITGGEITERRVATLGLAYDHRVINGADAIAFLKAVESSLTEPVDELLKAATPELVEVGA